MLKWCNLVHKKITFTADTSFFPPCKKNQTQSHEHTYESLDSSFRKEVDAVAWTCFSQQKFPDKHRDPLIFYLKNPQALENEQYKAWIKNIKIILHECKKESIQLKGMPIPISKQSVKIVLQNLTVENSLLIEENKQKNETIKFLLNKLEKIKKESSNIINALIKLTLSEATCIDVDRESLVPIRCKNYMEEEDAVLIRRVSAESGYGSDKESEVTSLPSFYSPLNVLEEDALLSGHQKLVKKNEKYKTRINVVEERFSSYSAAKNEFLALKDLSFQKIALIKQNKAQEERICLLEIQVTEAKEDQLDLEENNRALCKANLLKEIHQRQFLNQIDIWEENISQEQTELNRLEASLKNGATLNANIETFTKCLEQTKKLFSLLNSPYAKDPKNQLIRYID